MAKEEKPETKTIEITNFGGRLTRILNGDMNSGFADFSSSWGYDPFSKPMNLTWLETPNDVTGPISDLPLAGRTLYDTSGQSVYLVGSSGKFYKINPFPVFGTSSILTADSVIGIGSVAAGSPTFKYGASMEVYGTPSKFYISHDTGINSISASIFAGADSAIGTASNFIANAFHPLRAFRVYLLFGNGPTFGSYNNGTFSSVIGMAAGASVLSLYSQITNPFPPQATVQDIDVSPDFNYAVVSTSETPSEDLLDNLNDRNNRSTSNGTIFQWNGSDVNITAGLSVPSFGISALQTYLQNNYLFSNDAFGSSMGTMQEKLLTLVGNKSPLPNATGVNGNFLFWAAPEVTSSNTKRGAALYYFGSLDQENPPGLYRLMRYDAFPNFTYQVPLVMMTNNNYQTVNNSSSSVASFGYGKHYFSHYDVTTGTGAAIYKLKSFYVSPTGYGTPQGGVYKTQVQLFKNKMSVRQIRVYTEPTASGNGFQIFCIGSDGTAITPANYSGVMSYSYAAGTDPTQLQGALERIDLNPQIKSTYALGIQVTNTGTTNMTIKKIEVDVAPSGK